jgi:hypothetical protein
MLHQNFLLLLLLLLGAYISFKSYDSYDFRDNINVLSEHYEDNEDNEDNEKNNEKKEEDFNNKKQDNDLLKPADKPKVYVCGGKQNINEFIQDAYVKYRKDIDKYRIGAKTYEYDFVENEQPLQGLGPSYENNFPSTLKKSNKMIVDQDVYKGNYTNLLNTPNNNNKTYYNDDPKY